MHLEKEKRSLANANEASTKAVTREIAGGKRKEEEKAKKRRISDRSFSPGVLGENSVSSGG